MYAKWVLIEIFKIFRNYITRGNRNKITQEKLLRYINVMLIIFCNFKRKFVKRLEYRKTISNNLIVNIFHSENFKLWLYKIITYLSNEKSIFRFFQLLTL